MTIRKLLLLLGFLLFGAVNVQAAENGDGIYFKYQLETGMKFGYQLTVKTATTQKVLGELIPRDEEWQIGYQMTVLSGSSNRGGALLRVTYDKIYYRLDSPFQQYSGQLTPNDVTLPERLKPYANLVGSDFKIFLQRIPKIEANTSVQPPTKPGEFTLEQLFADGGSEAQYSFANLVGNIFTAYPNGAQKFKVDGKWQGERYLNNGQSDFRLKTQYRIKTVDADRILVALCTPSGCKFQNEQSIKNNNVKLAKVVTVLTGSLDGQMEIAKESKLPLDGMLNLNLAGTVNRLGQVLPVTLKMTVQYRRL